MRRVLRAQGHIVALHITPRRAPRMGVQHERQQAQRFRLIRQQRGQHAAQPQAFFGEVVLARFGARRV